ncbi:diguanylate cyclase domain-containing protein [Pseudobacteroides cellulosolvens]|uniref:Diguanylate cyclase n=1 Tax=Pseudobacteroides cellulosolvens ATCC 35603 = DSM 2933 TaxID=398512 RepID=A0A0L6JKF8_9FIRM|nr:diguanylate cyclase [Pseudobacteroides cellulosolvens]KNY26235.1 diguanylate cyclase [Pseudobacteroides cellulosolvens ATCC 35603 = DSM 2933]
MNISEYKRRLAQLERENRILKQKLTRSEINRAMLEEMIETHLNTLKTRNTELEQSRELIRQSEARYRELAHRDTLTRLPNRAFFLEYLVQGLSRARCTNTCAALFFIDLDRFKPVNDNYGHEVGDMLLGQIAQRLQTCVQNNGIVARIGGDEFAILIENLNIRDNAICTANRILNMFSKPFFISGYTCQIGVSIGISLYPTDDSDPEKLLQKADYAMYNVKKTSCNNYRFYCDISQRESIHINSYYDHLL